MPFMKCGHVSNAKTENGDPCCAICIGFTNDAEIVVEKPSLEGRTAKCFYCSSKTDSAYTLPFFGMGEKIDSYYCGCFGWD